MIQNQENIRTTSDDFEIDNTKSEIRNEALN